MSVVIVGGGQAGVQVADSLRKTGYTAPITIISEEAEFPYQRPPLSKDYLDSCNGELPAALPLRNSAFYGENRIDLLQAHRVTSIDRVAKIVHFSGRSLPYEHLVLATGSGNRTLNCAGADAENITSLRTVTDANQLHENLTSAKSVAIIGAGFIGLELAAVASDRGCKVTILSHGERPLRRSVTPPIADWVTRWHQDRGVEFQFGQTAASFDVNNAGQVVACRTTSGDVITADLVVVGIGVNANDQLAADAGLETHNGIVVNENLQTSDSAIFAVGDCATFPALWAGGLTRVESVQNAIDQAKHVARVIVEGAQAYVDVPWFWSVQGKNRLQMAGVSASDDEVMLIGSLEDAKFSALCFRQGVLAAVESVNMTGEHISARKILDKGIPLYIEDVTGPDFSVKTFLKQAETQMAAVH